jgi:hypothetical protein
MPSSFVFGFFLTTHFVVWTVIEAIEANVALLQVKVVLHLLPCDQGLCVDVVDAFGCNHATWYLKFLTDDVCWVH